MNKESVHAIDFNIPTSDQKIRVLCNKEEDRQKSITDFIDTVAEKMIKKNQATQAKLMSSIKGVEIRQAGILVNHDITIKDLVFKTILLDDGEVIRVADLDVTTVQVGGI